MQVAIGDRQMTHVMKVELISMRCDVTPPDCTVTSYPMLPITLRR